MDKLTDEEKRIFLAAMSRERTVCSQTDSEMSGPINLVSICQSIENKVKASLWNDSPSQNWTPCFEKQPDKDGVHHVTVTFNGKSVTRDQVFHEGRWLPLGKLLVNGVSGEPEVIAWMEKPAPYQAPVLDLQQSGFGRT